MGHLPSAVCRLPSAVCPYGAALAPRSLVKYARINVADFTSRVSTSNDLSGRTRVGASGKYGGRRFCIWHGSRSRRGRSPELAVLVYGDA